MPGQRRVAAGPIPLLQRLDARCFTTTAMPASTLGAGRVLYPEVWKFSLGWGHEPLLGHAPAGAAQFWYSMELLNDHGEARMDRRKDTAVEAVLEQLIEHGPGEIASVFARAFELAMQIERERFLGAGLYERTPGRQGYANGYKPKRIDTPAGTVSVQVPKTAGHEGEPFYPQSLERGRRSVRAVMLAVAEMYIKG